MLVENGEGIGDGLGFALALGLYKFGDNAGEEAAGVKRPVGG